MKTISLIFIALVCMGVSTITHAQNEQPKNLRDSLLVHYTIEELKAMTPREMGNIVRKLRGQKPIHFNTIPIKEFDDNGIKIVNDISEWVSEEIDLKVRKIEEERKGYQIEVFPNSYADILEYYFRSFYSLQREFDPVTNKNYKEPLEEGDDAGLSEFGNASRRSYYFNKEGDLRLIEMKVGYNVNPGKKLTGEESLVYLYREKKYYIWNDTLVLAEGSNGEQRMGTEPSMYSMEMFDTTKVHCEAYKIYFFKQNGYRLLTKEGVFGKLDWKEKLSGLPFEEQGKGSSNGSIWFRNYWLEYEEYKQGLNDYLKPVPQSFLAPHVIEANH